MKNQQQPDPAQTDETCFIGRDEVLKHFQSRLSQRYSDEIPLIVYYGEPGCGKSALLRKLQQICGGAKPPLPYVSLDFGTLGGGKGITTALEAIDTLCNSLRSQAKKYPKSVHRRRLDQFLQILQLLKKYTDGNRSFAKSSEQKPIVKYCGIVPALYTLFLALQGSAEMAVVTALASGIIFNTDTIEAFANSFQERNSQSLKSLKNAVADDMHFTQILCSEFAAVFMKQSTQDIKAVVFLDTYEMVNNSNESEWLDSMCRILQQMGILCVVSGQHPLIKDRSNVVSIPVYGFTQEEATKHLNIGRAEDPLVREILSACQTQTTSGTKFYNPSLLTGYLTLARNELKKNGTYPDSLNLEADADGNMVKPLLDKIYATIPFGYQGIRNWLQELAVTPTFDEGYARELYAKRNSGGDTAVPWSFIRELSILTREDLKVRRARKHVFYNISSIYRRELLRDIAPADAENIYELSVDYWIKRASEDLNEHGAYVMEELYWQQMVSLALSNSQRTGSSSDRFLSASHLTVLSFVLEIYWWWSENVPQDYWNRMLEDAIQSVPDDRQTSNKKQIKLKHALQIILDFDHAWPKGWQRHPGTWSSKDGWDYQKDGWDYQTVINKVNELRSAMGLGSGVAFSPAVQGCQDRIDAILSSYEGYAYRFLAVDPYHEVFFEKAKQAFERLAKKGHGGISENTNIYKLIWSSVALAELYADKNEFEAATGFTEQAFRDLRSLPRDEPGVEREGSSNVYHVLNTIAMRQERWKEAGKMMGRALVYSFGFYASDQDAYAYAYHHTYQRKCVEADLRKLHERDQAAAAAYLNGFQEQWQGAGGPLEAEASIEITLAFVFLKVIPAILNKAPDELSEEAFEDAETLYTDLSGRFSGQFSSPIKPG